MSGDANWVITDTNQYEGTYSATVASDDIEASFGIADLSINIITEQGGMLAYKIFPSVAGPFDLANVLIDDLIVSTFSDVEQNWLNASLTIQPGNRKVTFQLSKNPGNLPDDVLLTIPSPPDRLGQIWLDDIVFTTN